MKQDPAPLYWRVTELKDKLLIKGREHRNGSEAQLSLIIYMFFIHYLTILYELLSLCSVNRKWEHDNVF